MPCEGSTRGSIPPGCISLDKGSREGSNHGPSGERQPLNDKNKTDPGILGESLDPVYQSVNPTSNQAQWESRSPHPGRRVAAPKRFVIFFITLCQAKGRPPL
ncbi:hypothetical protein CSKR_110440 [Clonorchis sinensis]|uniref:Uncharacterized protein n=1 Tax=Clonorchis sinensis TaxID=79923 RepID=A0A3R7GK70_CLOSI|nr:hypothetical protein CSKR_110440 [Clonorchis sinensis]